MLTVQNQGRVTFNVMLSKVTALSVSPLNMNPKAWRH